MWLQSQNLTPQLAFTCQKALSLFSTMDSGHHHMEQKCQPVSHTWLLLIRDTKPQMKPLRSSQRKECIPLQSWPLKQIDQPHLHHTEQTRSADKDLSFLDWKPAETDHNLCRVGQHATKNLGWNTVVIVHVVACVKTKHNCCTIVLEMILKWVYINSSVYKSREVCPQAKGKLLSESHSWVWLPSCC